MRPSLRISSKASQLGRLSLRSTDGMLDITLAHQKGTRQVGSALRLDRVHRALCASLVLPHPPIKVAITRDIPPLSGILGNGRYSDAMFLVWSPRGIGSDSCRAQKNWYNLVFGGRRRPRFGLTIEPLMGGGELAIEFCPVVGRRSAERSARRPWFVPPMPCRRNEIGRNSARVQL